jgi:hypothetical protein
MQSVNNNETISILDYIARIDKAIQNLKGRLTGTLGR